MTVQGCEIVAAAERGPTESGEKEVQGFGDAGAAGGLGEIAALLFDLGKNVLMGVGRAGEVVAVAALEHGEVVQIVPGNEGGGWPKIQQGLDVAEAGALVVVGMGEAEVGAVAEGGKRKAEGGKRNAECGMRKAEMGRWVG